MTSLPPAGWYDDPTDAAMQRWWDGDKWTEHRRAPAPIATGGPASGDMRAPGEMVGHAFSLVRDRAGGIIASGLFAALPIVALFALVFVAASSVSFEFNVGETPDVDAEGGIALFFIVLVVALVVLAAAFLAMVTLLWDAAVGRERSWSAAVANGFRRLFPYLGWMLLGILPIILITLLIGAIAGGASEDAGGLLGLVITIPLIYWAVVLYFVPVMVVRESGGNPIAESWELVKGRWWRIFGRMLLWGLLMFALAIGVFIAIGIVGSVLGDAGTSLSGIVAFIIGLLFIGGYFLWYALQTAPIVSITYDLVGEARPAGDPTATF